MKTIAISMIFLLLSFQVSVACDCGCNTAETGMTQEQLEQIVVDTIMNPTPDDSGAMCLGLAMCSFFSFFIAFGIYFLPCMILMLAYC